MAQCPSCGRMLDVPEPPMEIPIPVLALDEPDPEVILLTEDSLVDPKPAGERWSRSRVISAGVAVPVVILAMVAGYASHRRSVGRERAGILDEFSKVDRLSFEERNAEAAETRGPRRPDSPAAKISSPGEIRGAIFLEKSSGGSLPLPNVEIRLMPSRTTFASLGETGALLSLDVSRAKDFDMGTMTDVGPAFHLLRDTGVDLPAEMLMTRFIDDNEWPGILSRIAVREALSDSRGEFRFDDVAGGDYLVHAVVRVPNAQMEWLAPATVDGGVVDVMLDIDHAAYGLTSGPRFEEGDSPRSSDSPPGEVMPAEGSFRAAGRPPSPTPTDPRICRRFRIPTAALIILFSGNARPSTPRSWARAARRWFVSDRSGREEEAAAE